jgi:metallo-beta-lactamase family protein
MQLRFLGGAGTITGSKLLVERDGRRLLLDCGLYQGLKQLRLRNRSTLPVASSSIDAVVLSRADLSHCGFLPRLVELGYRGPVYASPATVELCRLLLPEAGRLQEDDARLANQLGYSKHAPALPLYTEGLARQALEQMQPLDFGDELDLNGGMKARLAPLGQSLGAASVHLSSATQSLLYVPGLGRADDPLLRAPAPPEAADQVLLGATYGHRHHRPPDALARLAKLIGRTAARGGTVLLPVQPSGVLPRLLHGLAQLQAAGRIPELPIVLDNPVALEVMALYRRYSGLTRAWPEADASLPAGVTVAEGATQALDLCRQHSGAILIAVDGMAHGGPLAQHLKELVPDPRHAIAFTSVQPAGTRGAALLAGKPQIKVHGGWIGARAEVMSLDGLSGHADRQGLLDWILRLPRPPRHLYLMQGEPEAADSLRQAIAERTPWACTVAEDMEMANIRETLVSEEHGVPAGA